MAKRIQKHIKKFRGPKQVLKEARNDFMVGQVKTKIRSKACGGKRAQPFRAPIKIEGHKLAFDEEEEDDEDLGQTGQTDDCLSEEEAEEDAEDEEEDAADDEEEETQVVTPTSNGKREPQDYEVLPTTVEQYQAMLRTVQAQLLRAERQIRAISKSSLVDKFLETEIKKYVKQGLWKRCKFITCRETMEECMEEVADTFSVKGNKREHWKSTYEHAVRAALNNRRNNTAQDLKKELIGTCRLKPFCCAITTYCHANQMSIRYYLS
jgi:hypothetical protein